MSVLELKKGLSDAKAGKPIHFAFLKSDSENRLLLSKLPLKVSTAEVLDAKKQLKQAKIFVGICGGVAEDGKVNFFIDGFAEDKDDKTLAGLIEKVALAEKVPLKVKATAAPVTTDTSSTSTTSSPTPTTPTVDPSEKDKQFFETKMEQTKTLYEKALLVANGELKSKMEALFKMVTSHAESKDYVKANQALAVLAVAIGKAQPTTPSTAPKDTTTPTTGTPTPAEAFESKLKEVQVVLRSVVETAGFDPAVMKELQKMLKQAVVHKSQTDFEAGSELLEQILTKGKDGLKVAAQKPKDEAPKKESTEAKVERVLKERTIKRDRAALTERLAVDSIIAGMPPGIDIAGVRAIMNEHRKQAPLETKAFAGLRFFDDILLIKDEGKRAERMKAINNAMLAVKSRQSRLSVELAGLPEPTNDEERDAIAKAKGLRANMMNHIPDWWQGNWQEDFQERVKVMALDPVKKKEKLEEAKKGFNEDDRERQAKVFKATIDPLSLKGFAQHDSFFDHLTASPSVDELNAMAAVTDELLKKARQIRDAGGSLEDVKKILAHIPETWWPPELVDYMQAWRKAERELSAERVEELMEPEDSSAIEGVESAIEMLSAALDQSGVGTDWIEAPGALGAVTLFVNSVSNGFELGKGWADSVNKGDFSKFKPEAVEKFSDNAMTSVKLLCQSLASIKENTKLIPEESVLCAKVIPGLSIAAAGIDLFLAIKKLGEHSKITHGTTREISEAEKAWAKGQDEDGGAFVRTMKNERRGRIRQVSKDSVDVTTAGLELTGAIGEMTGIGTLAGKIIKVTGTAIEYGGKVVFTTIDWKDANRAKKLIVEAQGGNPVARIQIMEDCNRYAKMYIAILVRDKHPLAKKFIEVRGIEEGDLDKPTSMKILREALLESADQKDETTISDNLGVALLEGVGFGAIPKGGSKIAALAKTIKDKFVDRNAGVYDPKWKHEEKNVALVRTAWDTTKQTAFTKGLHDENTGIGAALEKVQSSLAEVKFQDKDANTKVQIVAAIKDLDDVYTRLNGYCPLTVPQGEKKEVEPHKGMTLFVVEMKTLVFSTLQKLDQLLIVRKDKVPTWTTKDASIVVEQWKKNWTQAVAVAMLDPDDCGVEKAMTAAIESMTAVNKTDVAPTAEREAKLSARDKFVELVSKLDECWSNVADCQGMRDYIDLLKEKAALQARVLQKLLFAVKWENPAEKMDDNTKFSSAGWKTTWEAACKAGVVRNDKAGAGLQKALADFELKTKAVEEVKKKGVVKTILAARKKLGESLTGLFVASNQFIADQQKEAVADILLYGNFIGKTAQQKLVALTLEMAEVKFTPVAGFTAASWMSTYEAAVLAGAVSEEKSLAGKLETALENATEAWNAFQKEKIPKQRRTLASTAMQKLGAVQMAASKMSAADGYADHVVMGPYLSKLSSEAGTLMQHQEIKDVLEGVSVGQSFPAQSFAWTKDGWLLAKNAAVEAGLFDSANTGFTGILTSAQSFYMDWKIASKEDKHNAAATARAKLGEVVKKCNEFAAATKNANWKKFFEDGIVAANGRIKEMEKD